jgi:glycosyl transferase family 25
MQTSYRCYVVSLAREPQKSAEFLERNRATGLPFTVFPAVDGSALTLEDCVERGLIAADAIGYSRGTIGAGGSHSTLWKEADATGSNLLIFEDDAYCRHDIARQIDELLSGLPDWDLIFLGYNTDAVLDIRMSEHFNFAGFFSNPAPSHGQLQAFANETGRVVAVRLNNAFGLCSYLISPHGARKLISLFPMDNRRVRIPGNMASLGRDTFRCMTVDMITNTLYPSMSAYAAIPPLAIPLNHRTSSTTMRGPPPRRPD